jgi:hypothetical protein
VLKYRYKIHALQAKSLLSLGDGQTWNKCR